MRLFLLFSAFAAAICSAQTTVPTAQYDAGRTNANMSEPLLSVSNVNPSQFGKLASRALDSTVFALPLVVNNVWTGGKGFRNVVFVATTANTVYALDADDFAEPPLWTRNLGAAPLTSDGWLTPSQGIIGTPAIDIWTSTIYLVANVGPADSDHLWLYALDLATGADKFGSPSQLTFPNNGQLVPSTPFTIQRAGLLVSSGSVYVAIAYFRPDGTWISQDGFVFRYSAWDVRTVQARFQSTPTGLKGGIWQAGRGLAVDAAGYLYVAVAGGSYDGVTNFGSSVVKLHPFTLAVTDWYTPANYDEIYHNNLDLSAGGPVVIPNTNLLLAGGKEGILYLLNRSSMGHLDSSGAEAVQKFRATGGCGSVDCTQTLSTAFWNSTSPAVFVWDRHDVLRAYSFSGGRLNQTPFSTSTVRSEMTGNLTVSSNGKLDGSGVVWALTTAQNADDIKVPATLRAFDARDVSKEIYNSEMNGTRDQVGSFTKFASPVVANGKVYVVTQSNVLQVYGPLCGVDVTGQTTITRSAPFFNIFNGKYSQTVSVKNNGTSALSGPIHIAFDGLPANARITNQNAWTTCAAPAGSPLKSVLSPSSFLPAGWSWSTTIDYTWSGTGALPYTAHVIAGAGAR